MHLFEIARDDGIPLAWVPRGDVIVELAAGATRSARVGVLEDRASMVVEDCAKVVQECIDESMQHQAPLARKAVEAFQAGHPEAAMALAVSLAEPLSLMPSGDYLDNSSAAQIDFRQLFKARYQWAKKKLAASPVDTRRRLFREHLVIAPVPNFFVRFFPWEGPPPVALSRHVVAHQPTIVKDA